MSELKDIVPPLELCKLIPAKEFEDSVLVWKHHEIFFRGIDIMDQTDRVTFRADEQNNIVSTYSSTKYYPAPTLAEIFRVLPETIDTPEDEFCVLSLMPSRDDDEEDMFWIGYNNTNGKDANPATAALRLWLKVKGDGDVR